MPAICKSTIWKWCRYVEVNNVTFHEVLRVSKSREWLPWWEVGLLKLGTLLPLQIRWHSRFQNIHSTVLGVTCIENHRQWLHLDNSPGFWRQSWLGAKLIVFRLHYGSGNGSIRITDGRSPHCCALFDRILGECRDWTIGMLLEAIMTLRFILQHFTEK